MTTSLSRRVEALKQRRSIPLSERRLIADSKLAKSLDFDGVRDAIEYVQASASEVDAAYTQKTLDEAKRVQTALDAGFLNETIKPAPEFRHQGSVTNNTHIRLHSDIDLLVLERRFIMLQPPLVSSGTYKGNVDQDLAQLRSACLRILESTYTAADVDASGAKSVTISGGSLRRKIDVVPACWLDTEDFRTTKQEVYRGIQVLDSKTGTRITNYPFRHNAEVDRRDRAVGGRLRPLVRLVKSIKADSDSIPQVSSYDIVSICCHVDDSAYSSGVAASLIGFLNVCVKILNGNGDVLKVPNGTRRIVDGVDKQELKKLGEEIVELAKLIGPYGVVR